MRLVLVLAPYSVVSDAVNNEPSIALRFPEDSAVEEVRRILADVRTQYDNVHMQAAQFTSLAINCLISDSRCGASYQALLYIRMRAGLLAESVDWSQSVTWLLGCILVSTFGIGRSHHGHFPQLVVCVAHIQHGVVPATSHAWRESGVRARKP